MKNSCAGSEDLFCQASYRTAVENRDGVWLSSLLRGIGGGRGERGTLWQTAGTLVCHREGVNGKRPGRWLSIHNKISYCLSAVNWCCSALCVHLVFMNMGEMVAESVGLSRCLPCSCCALVGALTGTPPYRGTMRPVRRGVMVSHCVLNLDCCA